MTSTPDDGELGRRLNKQKNDQVDTFDEALSGPGPAVDERAEDAYEDDELPHLEQEDIIEEEQRASTIDEADTIPADADTTAYHQNVGNQTQSTSITDSDSIPDDAPSVHESGLSTPRSEAPSSQPSSTPRAATPPRRPFDLRFQSRLSSSPLISPRASSPAFLHSRQSSLASIGAASIASDPDDATAPWEVMRWKRLGKITSQAFSEIGRRNFGSPTCLTVTDHVVVGTSKGTVLVFDHQQSLKAIIGAGTKAAESGPVTALAISADHSTVAVGHATGHIFTWEIARSSRPFLHVPPIDGSAPETRRGDGHVDASTVLHIGFLGFRRTALVSADDRGMAFSHLATRGTGALARRVKTTRILGRYPDLVIRTGKPTKKSSVLAFAPLPLGNVEQNTDSQGLVAMLTPYLLVIVSTTPIAQTQHKAARPREVSAHGAMTAALAWFPAIKLKGNNTTISKPKLVYAWSDVLTVLEIHEVPAESEDEKEKPPELQFVPRSRFKAEEAIVAVQWLSRSVMAVLTITQQLLILEDITMKVTDSFDLLAKDIYHVDMYSRQLRAVVENLDEDDMSMHGVVADAFHMSFRAYKGRLFLLGFKNAWWGSLTNWADRLIALMEVGDYIGAIRLATNYYLGLGEKLTIGLPEDDEQRSGLVREKLMEMMAASLRYAFGKNQMARTGQVGDGPLRELAEASITACLHLGDQDFLFEEVFAWYDDHGSGPTFIDVLEPHILDGAVDSLPAPVIKTLISHFKRTHSSSALEEILCLLDPTTMDIDQVTSLCKQNDLYEAYIYVWNVALQDYVGPLKELLDMAFHQGRVNGDLASSEVRLTNIAHKMFAYLSFILTGRVYPTGTVMEEPRSSAAKLQIYDFLFSASNRDTLRHADSSESYSNLRAILTFDTASFMRALNEAFEDGFLNDDEVTGSSPCDYSHVKIYNRQYIVQILLAVMSSGFDAQDAIYLDMFIGRNLPKYPQYMLLTGSDLQDTFMRLCHYDDDELRDDAQLSVEYLLTAYHPPDILKLVPVLQRAQFYRVMKSIFRQEHRSADLVDTYFQDPEDKTGVFEVIVDVLRPGLASDDQQKADVAQIIADHTSELLNIDISSTALTIEAVLPHLHSVFIESMSEDTWRQFRYLRTLVEPDQSAVPVSANLPTSMLELYVRLMCQHDPGHVGQYVKAVKEDDLRLEFVIPAMESSGVIDAAVILLTRQGQTRDAMDRLTKHVGVLQTALMSIVESARESPDQVVTDEAIDDLLDSIDRYTQVGIWMCQNQKPTSAAKSPRKSAVQQPLNFGETLWLDLIVCVVSAAQGVSSVTAAHPIVGERVQSALRRLVQEVFTVLLSATTSARGGSRTGNDFAFLRILRAFLTQAAQTSPTLSELRGVIASIFSAYAYEESLLTLSNAMLDKDLFVHVDEVAQLRRQGWRPRGQVCEICRRRVWGPGTGLTVWETWEADEEKRRARRQMEHARPSHADEGDASRGKGKATASAALTSTAEEQRNLVSNSSRELGPLVVFSCRHLYHQRCLAENDRSDDGSGQTSMAARAASMPLRCPSCP